VKSHNKRMSIRDYFEAPIVSIANDLQKNCKELVEEGMAMAASEGLVTLVKL